MFRVMDATCKFLGLGQGTDSVLHLSQPVSKPSAQPVLKPSAQPVLKPSAQPVLKWAITFHQSRIGPAHFETDVRLRNGLSCESGLNVYAACVQYRTILE